MKKLILTAAAVFALGIANGQEQTKSGKLLVEVNTGFGGSSAGDGAAVGSTALGFTSYDGVSTLNIGAEGGYFIMDNLALKVGLGYGSVSPKGGDSQSVFGYKIGAKYYVSGMIPVEVSYNGASNSATPSGAKVPSWIGLQAGYAVFLGDMVSLEPGIRYNYGLLSKDDNGGVDTSVLQFNLGFVLHF